MSCGVNDWDVSMDIQSSESMGRSGCVTFLHSRHFILSCGPQRNRMKWSSMKMTTRRTSGLTSFISAPLLSIERMLTTMASMMAQRPHGQSVRHTSTANMKKIMIVKRPQLSILKLKDILKHLKVI
ncbi:hypothetical protein FR483_n708R [Paramecium bursaria Chlorella virus FR483]|uniref:Uncharacterized protein n708R n=1 Tax=Paramecium bursaria Chlorella virus FR483 TaxID=399781 RepID=A7J862_PBCVF|nr:hypothetical protein FR483_n708R [Paramecium bursaria Chlorella virus FR483]ABT15993.1 hypothetical protein FR483_n708R [Paramecium bursaria Chlorella virus FR483]